VISWLAATISGSAGFGGALILLPVLNAFVGIKAAVPILTVVQLLGNMSRAGFGFTEIKWRPVGLFILGALPATIIGARLFISLPKQNINIGIGIVLIIEVHLMADFEFTITETDSMIDLEEYLNYLIFERCNEIYYKIINQDAVYQNLQSQIKSCFAELLQALPEPGIKKS
jgi:hypothetical protein